MNKLIIVITAIALVLGAYFIGTKIAKKENPLSNDSGNFSQSIGSAKSAKLTSIVDLKNGDSYDLTATVVKKEISGRNVKMLAYNGSIPGPTIRVPKGAEITVNFINNTDVPSTIHSHGVRLDNEFDGVENVTQKAVEVGEKFTYKLKFPDEGVYFYHPHIREDYAQELGLYGNFIVVPEAKDYWAEVDREETIFLDDILMEDGKIATFSKSTVDRVLMGRFGNTMLVNGDDKYKLPIKQGERVRFYVTNAANTRVFNFSIPNTRMKLVGADNGKYEREEWVDTVILGPSERIVVEVWFEKSGDFQIVHKTPQKTYTMGTVAIESNPTTTSYLLVPRTNQDIINSINPLRPLFAKPSDKKLNLTIDMMGMNNMQGSDMEGMYHMMPYGQIMEGPMMMQGDFGEKIEWEDDMAAMNQMATSKMIKWKLVDDATKKENTDINWQFKKGDKIKLTLFNDPNSDHPMQHPIHIHGQRFLVLATNGVANNNMVFKDTVLVQKDDTVDILVGMENPGKWVLHCHIPEHMEAGMISNFEVI